MNSGYKKRGYGRTRRLGPCRGSLLVMLLALLSCAVSAQPPELDILITGARVYDGAGNPWLNQDVGIADGRIAFLGHARSVGIQAREQIDARGLLLSPGFIDMHTHADPHDPEGRQMLPSLYQGITTILIGVDGQGKNDIEASYARMRTEGVGVNVLSYVGFNAARQAVLGNSDASPDPDALQAMQAYVDKGMQEGAIGISSGLFYTPATYATTDEVVAVAAVSGRYGGIYDTHDRDLGAVYGGVGYLASTAEAIEIGERSGNRVIFSHFTPQSVRNKGRADEGAALIDAARARGVNVMAAQHPYTASNSSLFAYTAPGWLLAGGLDAMLERLRDAEIRARAERDHREMLAIRGGPEKLRFTDEDPSLSGKTLAELAEEWGLSTLETVERIAAERQHMSVPVMNIDLYDQANIDYLAAREWMMTCTDGLSVRFGEGKVHPRSYGAFPKKLREMVLDQERLSLPFVLRGMSGLAASFIGLPDRGYIKQGFWADLVLIDPLQLRDTASYEAPHAYATGMVHVLVNGEFAIRDGKATGQLAGQPIPRIW